MQDGIAESSARVSPSLRDIRMGKIVDPRTWPRDQVRDPEAKLRQPIVGSNVIGSGTRPDSYSSFQNRLE